MISTPSLPTQPMKLMSCYTSWGLRPMLFQLTAAWVLLRPKRMTTVKELSDGSYGLSSLSESGLTICRCHSKGSTFSSVILRPCVLVGPDLNPQAPARQTGTYPIELGRSGTKCLHCNAPVKVSQK